MAKIVSANYRDQKSPERWLVRDADLHPEAAKSFRSVVATGVRFTFATDVEEGFGSNVVAFCDTAVGSDQSFEKAQDGKRLRFNTMYFVDEDDNPVDSCARLVLNSDGHVYAYGTYNS